MSEWTMNVPVAETGLASAAMDFVGTSILDVGPGQSLSCPLSTHSGSGSMITAILGLTSGDLCWWLGENNAQEISRWFSGERIRLQCQRHRFDPWIGKIPWRRKLQPTTIILAWRMPWTEETGGLQSRGCKELDMTDVT